MAAANGSAVPTVQEPILRPKSAGTRPETEAGLVLTAVGRACSLSSSRSSWRMQARAEGTVAIAEGLRFCPAIGSLGLSDQLPPL